MKKALLLFTLIASVLAGCGGGGGGGGGTAATPTPPVTSFPLQSGYKSLVANGFTASFTVSGSCGGTANLSMNAPTGATFEGVSGLSVTQTLTINLTNCTPASQAITGINYYDTNYIPLGGFVPGVEYNVFSTPPTALPTSVKVGDTAVYGTVNTYKDSTKAVATGTRQYSYVIESDTASTAIANLISKTYNTSSQLLSTQQSRYRMDASGTLTPISNDVQYSTTSTMHLIYTKT